MYISILTFKTEQKQLRLSNEVLGLFFFFFPSVITKLKFVGRRTIFLMFSTWLNIPRQQLQAKYNFSK